MKNTWKKAGTAIALILAICVILSACGNSTKPVANAAQNAASEQASALFI